VPGVPHVVAAWQSEQTFEPPVAVVTCAWCVSPVALPTFWMSVWHITHAVVFVVVLPYQLKSIPAVVVVALLLWQSRFEHVPLVPLPGAYVPIGAPSAVPSQIRSNGPRSAGAPP
jgi:hypothetical protein